MGTESIDKSGFDACYEKYKDVVFRTVLRYIKDKRIAEEITQEVFLKLYLYLDHTAVDNAKAWLLTTVKHMAYNYSRTGSREIFVDTEEEGDEVFGSEDSAEDMFFRELRLREEQESHTNIYSEVLDGLYCKNKRWYEAVTLVYGAKVPQKEAAECLGVTLEVLHSMLYRSRSWIKKNYKAAFDEIFKK